MSVELATLQVASLLYHEVTDDPASSGFQRASAMPYQHTRRAFSRDFGAIAEEDPGADRAATAISVGPEYP